MFHPFSVGLLGEMHVRAELTTNSPLSTWVGLANPQLGLGCPACPAEHIGTFYWVVSRSELYPHPPFLCPLHSPAFDPQIEYIRAP